ncbi:WD40/YVTN/BNR-like repeat-containing protein [Flexivirga meconopsidis]|uniref:WD40/YVTN/BNR-like repeat-containing protein n=1 Tax=Flexivirga meconopsidis TaxID=2977121 RepID=UPI00223F5310|nr:hypothetical protein [Flexivirga meconopsidis]
MTESPNPEHASSQPPPRRPKRTALIAGGAAFALLAAGGVTVVAAGGPEKVKEALGGEHDSGGESLHEFAKENKGINRHSQALSVIMEKKDGGSGEVVSGPNQETYENQAFPRTTIAAAQSSASRAQFQAIARNGKGGPPGLGVWTLLPNTTGTVPDPVTYTGKPSQVSGRTTSVVIDPNGTTAYIGSAGGGVWKTDDITAATPNWHSVSDSLPSQAIGTLTLSGGVLYAGTGEPNGSSDSEAGVGLFKSTDGGSSWSEVKGFHQYGQDRSVATVAVDPTNSRHLLVGTQIGRHGASSVNGGRYTPPGAPPVGLFETTDGGATWKQVIKEQQDAVDPTSANGNDFFRGGVTKVEFDPNDPKVTYASVSDYGLYRRGAGDAAYSRIYTISTPGSLTTSPSSRIEFDATSVGGKTRIYLGDATRYKSSVAGLLRTDDAQAATPAWTELSSPDKSSTGYDSYNFCQGQCSYDMAVTTPKGEPNTVALSGSMNYDEIFTAHQPSNGRAIIRSTNAGVSFTDMTNDASNNGLHPDQHGFAFFPNNPNSWVATNDGGVTVESGPFVDKSADCNTRGLGATDLANCKRWLSAIPTSNRQVNQGLQTLQYQSISTQGGIVQGGTQDNGTWESDYPGGWAETVGGDGGNSAINPADTNIRFHTYYNPQMDVNFHGSSATGWDWIADPLLASGEASSFYIPVEADKTAPGTVYAGLQHVFRTTDNGGKQADLDKHCNELTGDFTITCGDFVALGGAKGDLSGSAYGADNAGAGNYVVSVVHAQRKTNIMWAATRRGRLFISTNANAADANSVSYTRLDKTATGDALPTRFISGISLDPANPYHAIVSYSGYSEYAAGGHVYDVTYNPATKTVTSKDISSDLGDQPVTGVQRDWRTGAIYIGTDFGVLTRPAGGTSWLATPGMPQVAVYGLTLDDSGKRLYAATHGRGVYVNRIN